MTAYTFETITPDQAAGFTAGDTLTFTTPGATASQVVVVFTPASGGSGIPPSPILPAKTTLIYSGISRDFPSASLAGYGGSTGQINFPDGSMLYPGTSGADSLQGSGFGDGLYGDFGDDTFNGGNGDDFIQGNAGADSLVGGEGNDTLHGGRDADLIVLGTGANWSNGNLGADTVIGHATTPGTNTR